MPKEKNDNGNVAANEQHDDLLLEGDYDAAFEEASGDTPVASAEGSDQAADDQENGSAEEEEGSEGTPPSKKEEEETPPIETPAPVAADKALTNRIAELEKQLAEQTKPTESPAATPEKPTALSEEDQEALDETAEDWPTINRALEIKINQLEHKIAQLIDQKIGTVQEQIKPIAKTTQETAHEKFKTAIMQKHADAFELLPEVEKWIETQPDYLQPGYNHVLDRGSVKQVVDLLTQFKEATGKTEPTPEDKGKQGKDDRLARMEGVRTQRTGLSTDDDPSDFDGAFDKAASQ